MSYGDPELGLAYMDGAPDFSLPAGLESRPATRAVTALQSARLKLSQDEERFRTWYMATLVDRFPTELDNLRPASNNPTTNNSTLDILVAALGAGVHIFDDRVPLPSAPSSSSNPFLALDDHHLVLQTLDLLAKQNHLDPALCPPNQPPSQDVEMSSVVDDS